jgi:hypothetical protein
MHISRTRLMADRWYDAARDRDSSGSARVSVLSVVLIAAALVAVFVLALLALQGR